MRKQLYKRDRAPARAKGVLAMPGLPRGLSQLAPLGCPDANVTEVKSAIFVLAWRSGLVVGKGSGYDAMKNTYEVIGQSRRDGRKQDMTIQGEAVADLIKLTRILNGGQHQPGALV